MSVVPARLFNITCYRACCMSQLPFFHISQMKFLLIRLMVSCCILQQCGAIMTQSISSQIQCSAVITRSIFSKYSQRTPHSSPARARYGVSFVDPKSGWHSDAFLVIIHVICYNIRPRYNGTPLYSQKTSYSSPVKARYGVSFVDPASDSYSISVPVIIYVVSYNIGPCYNDAVLYLRIFQTDKHAVASYIVLRHGNYKGFRISASRKTTTWLIKLIEV